MLGSVLGYALERGLWAHAQAIAQPLNDYWDSRGLTEEAVGWVDRARLALEAANGRPPPLDDPAEALWLYFVISQVHRQLTAHQLDAAERTYLDICNMLQQQPESPEQLKRLTGSYLGLGAVAQMRGCLDDAQEWCLKSLAITEELGDRSGIAMSYHDLGNVAQGGGRLDNAQDWYLKSVTLKEELGDRPGMAISYHQLGQVAQDMGRLDDAQDWYLKSLAITEELGNRPVIASSYHQLGVVAKMRGRLDDAQEWCLKSLAITEELSNRSVMASSYHLLGMVAQDRGRLDDAQEWYLKSLIISEEVGYRPMMAATFGQMGLLAEMREHPEEAMEWMIRCVALFDEFPHPVTGPGPTHLARLTALLGIDALERCWQRVTGKPLPRVIRDFIASNPSE